jgi:DMSO/TMAO reductase YedYZ molybdopterin-dependent catalytic subunit
MVTHLGAAFAHVWILNEDEDVLELRASAGTWEEFKGLPSEEVTTDIHCVTKWSKLGTRWKGVSVDALLEGVETAAEYLTAFCDGDYTTNLPVEDVAGGKAWVACDSEGELLEPEHGGPARLLVPHLYFWKSAKWVRGLEELTSYDIPGFCRELLGALALPKVRRERRQDRKPDRNRSGSRTLTGDTQWTTKISGYSASPAASGEPPSIVAS